jgi:cellulose synthase/poly-beta-1,6-N-acetylglucosamine synthase-like glycosyltransferase
MSDAEADLRLRASISGLAMTAPSVSVERLLTSAQRGVLLGFFGLLVVGLILSPVDTVRSIVAIVTIVYVVCIAYRGYLFVRSSRSDVLEIVTDEEARAVPDESLPTYTVLIPAYREPEVISHLLTSIARMEYPVHRLEVLILAEADDTETIEAVRDEDPGRQFTLVLVPPAEPRTKPKALNFGLTLARGELVAVYDVEDEPDPLQLRRAAVALRRLGPEVGCVQAKLSYNNPDQNLITRWFTIEYAMWFSFFLPGLASMRAPIPLGGTSNHFRRLALRSLGGWDPYNVTEDADLGIRMFREGYTVKVLESVTLEEANSDFVNWVKQRSRWYKGYLQTLFVHTRSPLELVREMGWKGAVHFLTFVGGTPLLAVLNPVFWIMTALWFIGHPAFIQEIFPAPVYYLSIACWAFGNFMLAYLTLLSCRITRRGEHLWAAFAVPLYWVMMSMAAVKAFWQLAGRRPAFWEKTVHGLDRVSPEAPRRSAA